MRQGQAEESIERSFGELIQRRAGPQVGLVVGKHSVGSRDLLLGLIKTPAQDGQEALLASSSASSANVTAPTNSSISSSKQGKKKGAGGSGGVGATPQPAANLTLDTDWVVEHAAQVSRMLPGGLAVLGLYVFCTDPSYQSLLAQLCAVLAAIASQCCQPQGDTSSTASPLLLHADASSRKLSLRSFDAQDGAGPKGGAVGGQLRMADLKFASSISSLVCLRCSHALDLALPTPASCGQLRQQLQDLGEEACQAISCAVAVVADSTHSTGSGSSPPITIPPESAPLMECIPPSPASPSPPASGAQVHVTSSSADRQPSQASPSSTPVLPITLFTPVGIRSSTASATRVDGASEGGKGEERKGAWASLEVVGTVGGQARLQGTVQGVVYCHQRETFGRSVVALKADLQASLRARMELVLEDATVAWEAQQQQQQQQQQQDGAHVKGPQHPLLREGPAALSRAVALPLPRRVLVPWMGQSLVLCDYLLPGEGIEAAAERAAELLSPPTASCSVASQASHLQADASPILILEAPSTSITAKQLPPWQPQNAHATPVVPGKPAAVQAATMNGANHARSWACKGGGAALAAGVAVVGVTLGWMSVYSSS